MAGIDASIPLGAKAPDQMQQLSGLLNAARGAQALQIGNQTLQQNQQATQQGQIDLQERQGVQRVLADPKNYTGDDGSFDPQKAQANIMSVAPTTGTKYWTALAVAHKQGTEAQAALNSLTTENRKQVSQALYSAANSPPDVVEKTLDTLGQQYKGMAPIIADAKARYRQALAQGPDAGKNFIAQAARAAMPQETQRAIDTPVGTTVDNGQESSVVNVAPGVSGIPQGGAVPGTHVQKVMPPGQQETAFADAQGNFHVALRDASGKIIGTRPLQGAQAGAPGPFTLPANETAETMKDLQAQRGSAQQAAVSAPVLHDINRTIVQEANKGLNTGSLGALTQRVASATGYNLAGESATDYNLLGKMLERSALTAAQGMGPHTNAGLEAAVRANGSLEYTPQAIKKIAYLNDAIVSGSELYHQGLEKAISGDKNGVFAKRQFDTEWGKVATPQVLRLKNAVDNGNQEEVASITKEVGGRGSAGARKLHQQLTQMLQLTGQ